MTSFVWPPTGGNGVPVYPTLADFPAGTYIGELAVAADTGNLYEWNGSGWQQIASPGNSLTVGTLDSQLPSLDGAVINFDQLVMQSASNIYPGLVNLVAQTFSGLKSFQDGLSAKTVEVSTGPFSVTLDSSAALASYTFKFPSSLGTSGQYLTSQGPGQPVVWTTPSTISGLTPNQVVYSPTSTTLSNIASVGTNVPLLSNGASPPQFTALPLNNASSVTGVLNIQNGGTARSMLNTYSVLIGNGFSPVIMVSPSLPDLGIPLISQGINSAPKYGQIDLHSSQAVTGALNVINGGTGAASLTAHAVIIGNALNGVQFAIPTASSGIPLVSLGSSANPAFGALNLSTAGSVSGSLTVPFGGTGKTTLTAYSLLAGADSAPIHTILPQPVVGIPLLSQGVGAFPSYSAIDLGQASAVSGVLSVSHGGTGVASNTANQILIGNNASPIESIANSATTGVPLVSRGSGNVPSFQALDLSNVSATTGILPIVHGGTGQSAININPTPNIYSGYDANSCLHANYFSKLVTVITSSTTPLALTESSNGVQRIIGTVSQAVELPTTLSAGVDFYIVNQASQNALVRVNGTLISTLPPNYVGIYTSLTTNPALPQSWSALVSAANSSPVFSGLNPGGAMYAQSSTTIGSSLPGAVGQALLSGGSGAPTFGFLSLVNTTGVLSVSQGGTGVNQIAQYSVVLGNGASPFSHAVPNTPGVGLVSNGSTSFPSFGALSLSTPEAVSGALPVVNGGTGRTTLVANGVMVGAGINAVSVIHPPGTAGIPFLSGVGDPNFAALNLSTVGAITGILPVQFGGTSRASLTMNEILLGNGTGAVTTVPNVSTFGAPLLGRGIGNSPVYGQLDLSTPVVTGTLPIERGGTGLDSVGTAGTVLVSDGTGAYWGNHTFNFGSMGLVTIFKTVGSFFFATPLDSSAATIFEYEVLGAGGGGGGGGGTGSGSGGGGQGAYARGQLTGLLPNTIIGIYIGSPGAGGAARANGGYGQESILGTSGLPIGQLVVCFGGDGGKTPANGSLGGVGGNVTSGSPYLSFSGQQGGTGISISNAGQGGFGGGNGSQFQGILGPSTPTVYGSGGAGASANNAGSPGLNGYIIIKQLTP